MYSEPLGLPAQTGLGEVGAVGDVTDLVSTAISFLSDPGDFLHFLQYPNDKKRKTDLEALARQASTDDVAYARLRLQAHRGTAQDIAVVEQSGQFPAPICPPDDNPIHCGAATTWAQDYAWKLATQVQQARASSGLATLPGGPKPTGTTLPTNASSRLSPLVWLAGGGLVLFALSRRGRRR